MSHQTHLELIEQLRRENDALKREVATLRTLSFEDPLTRLHNRRYFDQRLVAEVDRADRHGDPVSIVIVDVDDFKTANDTFGHEVGDRLLRWVARFLQAQVREHDVVCRTGGDEFAIILPRADAEGADQTLRRLRVALRQSAVDLGSYRVSLSLGAATWHDTYADLAAFVADADVAMYRDKVAKQARIRHRRSFTWT